MILTHGANSFVRGRHFVEIGGREYPYVKIGNLFWITENLDFKFDSLIVGENQSSGIKGNYYINDEATYGYNGNRYGLLYNPNAINYLSSNEGLELLNGFRVPSKEDLDALANAVGGVSIAGKHLKCAGQWVLDTGLDTFGFHAVPAGIYRGTAFYNLGWQCILGCSEGSYSGMTIEGAFDYVSMYNTAGTNDSRTLRLCKNAD